MTATQTFIELAIEGGWSQERADVAYHKHETRGAQILTKFSSIEKALLDPLAWQAVGKVRLENIDGKPEDGEKTVFRRNREKTWARQRMHGMIDALVEGSDIESYLSTIV